MAFGRVSRDKIYLAIRSRANLKLNATLASIPPSFFLLLLSSDVDEMEYELPYLKDVPKNPTSSDMFPVVFVEGIRPSFPQHWENEKVG